MNSTSVYSDELSGVYNRRYLKDKSEYEIQGYIAKNIPFSLVMVDIDHFKEINDIHGHLKGDEIIRDFAHYLRGALRKTDTVIRYGGDEFVCVMPRTMRLDAEWVYHRILKGVRERTFSDLSITLSVGIASYPGDGADFEGLFRAADQSLYDAKRSGRDRIGVVRRKKVELPMRVFIDRFEERNALGTVLSHGAALRVALVKGTVGVGKTRLARETLSSVKGKEVIWSDCISLAEDISYYPLREAIRYRLQRVGAGIFKNIPLIYRLEVGKLVPEMMQDTAEPVGIEAVLDKYRLYEGIRRVFEAGDRPKVLVIDNIQWIDQESIEVLKYVLRALRSHPLTLVCMYRVEEITERLQDFWESLSRDISLVDIELHPFESEDVRECLRAIIGEEPETRLASYVMETSGGIPFYIEELLRGLVERRCLEVEEDVWVFRQPDEEVVPRSLADIALRKYRGVSKEAQQVVDIASVVGRFDVGVLVSLTGYNEGHVMGLINEVSRLGMVRYVKDRFEFSEEMSRQALYQRNVSGLTGVTLHRRVAEELVKVGADVEELALHCYRGQERERGIQYCIEAGDKVRQKYANYEALRYYSWALDMLRDEEVLGKVQTAIDCYLRRVELFNTIGDSAAALKDLDAAVQASRHIKDRDREIAVLARTADTYYRLSRYPEALQTATNCQHMAEAVGDQTKLADALKIMGNTYTVIGESEKAKDYYEQALDIYRSQGDRKGEEGILNNLGVVFKRMGDYAQAVELYKQALSIAEELGYRVAIGTCITNLAGVYHILGDYRTALAFYDNALKIDREIGDKRGEALTCSNIGVVYDKQGDNQHALYYHRESLKMKRDIGDKRGEAISLSNIALISARIGDYTDAISYAESSLSLAREIGDKSVEAFALNVRGIALYALGDYHDALVSCCDAHEIIEQVHIDWQRFDNLIALARLHGALGKKDMAHEYLNQASVLARQADSKAMAVDAMLLYGEFYLDDDNRTPFEKLLQEYAGFSEELTTASQKAYVDLLRGRYYCKEHEYDKAEACLSRALQTFTTVGEKLNCGKAYYYLGILEMNRDTSAAREHMQTSLTIFTSIGAQAWRVQSEKALKDL